MATRTKTAARCTECERAMAVWRFPDGSVVPVGSVNGCPCGATAFRLLSDASGE